MQQQDPQQQPPNNDAQTALVAGAHQNANRRIAGADSTYIREWNRFKDWVSDKRGMNILPPGPKYLTRDAVDLYFTEYVAHLTVTPKTAQRIRPALQFYADQLEHVGQGFVIESQFVNEGIATQTHTYIEFAMRNTVDPHKNLPCNILTHKEHLKALDYIFTNNLASWQSLFMSWNLGNNTFIRCDKFLKLNLPNLLFNSTHGPIVGDNNVLPMLALILNAEQVKEGKKRRKKRIAGNWRHKHYLRCATGAVGMTLFTMLYYDNSINFYEGRENSRPSWWKIKLGFDQWSNTKVAGIAYGRLLDGCGINWGKIIHMRASGIEHASSMGELDAATISTLSKHQKSNLDKVYMTELFPPILRVMAGFSLSENLLKTNATIYHVPRTLIEIPWSDHEITHFIFPKIDIWRAQCESPEGDSSEAAKNFLYGVLPFLAKVVIQDGIYWVHDYPTHEISRLLLEVMPPNYECWSMETRKKNIEEETNENEALSSCLNEGAKAALLAVKETIKKEMKELQSNISSVSSKLNQIEMQLNLLARHENEVLPPPQQVPPIPPPPTNVPTAAQLPHPTQTVDEVLRNSSRVPTFPPSLPRSMQGMLHEYVEYKLSRWETAKMSGWPSNVKQAFSRRKYVNNVMKGRAMILHHGSFEQRLIRAVDNMENERKSLGKSVFTYIVYLKENDPSVKTRKRKERSFTNI